MRKYIQTLHTKPDHHKKQFAFLASATITLFIFGIWSLVNFGGGGVVAQNDTETNTLRRANEVSPLESIRTNIATSFAAIKGTFREMLDGFGENDRDYGR